MAHMKKRILVVDDEELVARLVGAILKSTDRYEVETSTNPYEAYARASAQRYDLLISDVQMPGLDGSKLFLCLGLDLDNFTRLPNAPKLLLMSGALTEQALEAKQAFLGNVGCLQKPFSSAVLLAKVEAILQTADYGEVLERTALAS
jgi:CheY-like chemotaxis protein